jgi:hypothetical protein
MSEQFEWRGVLRTPETKVRKDWTRKAAELCKKCGEPGHRQKTCGRPQPERNPDMRTLRCRNCGGVGHNRMTCTAPANPDYVPEHLQSTHSGKTRCTRCGANDHNVARCQQAEVTRVDRLCSGCGKLRENKKGESSGAWTCVDCYRAQAKRTPIPCVHCGLGFMPMRSSAKVCSEQCRRAAIAASQVGRFESLAGETFGWWTVTAHIRAKNCAVRCRCGFETMVNSSALRFGSAQSCRKCASKKRFEEMSDERRAEVEAHQRAAENRGRVHFNVKQKRAMYGVQRLKDVQKAWHRTRREERKKLLNQYKQAPCMDCHARFPPICMDFDHRPDEDKVENVSKMVIHTMSFDVIADEIKKCDLVCSNCHRIRTHRRMLEDAGQDDTAGSLVVDDVRSNGGVDQ